ncbi:MAG: transposase [Flavobacteriales bacterium]|nr:transposase [Flavobacteriales bacterium]
MNKDRELSRKNRLAQTVSGIGPVLSSELIAHTDGFTRFNTPRQLVCYVGPLPSRRPPAPVCAARPAPHPSPTNASKACCA